MYYTFTNTKTETNTQAKTTGPFKKHPQAPPKGPNITVCQSVDCYCMYYIFTKTNTETIHQQRQREEHLGTTTGGP